MKYVNVLRYDSIKNNFESAENPTSIEIEIEIKVDGENVARLNCSPCDIEDLAVGYLAQIGKIYIPLIKPQDIKFSAKEILNCADKLLSELAKTHTITHGVHSGVIFDGKNILVYREDIGRHNVFDKLFGWAIRNKIDLSDKMIIFSGRCSSEMMNKILRMNISTVAAKSVPTTLSIEIAKKAGITLIARMNHGSFCIYTNPQRIIND